MANLKSRPHRRSNCGTAQKITIAYYILTQSINDSDKLEMCLNSPNLIAVDKAYDDQRFLFMFNDESILGFDEDNNFYVADTWGRRDQGKKPTFIGNHARKVIYI